jgi:hypothetical protein
MLRLPIQALTLDNVLSILDCESDSLNGLKRKIKLFIPCKVHLFWDEEEMVTKVCGGGGINLHYNIYAASTVTGHEMLF